MCAIGVAGDIAFGAFAGIFTSQRKHVAAMATPVGADVRNSLEAMGYAMIDLVFIVLLWSKT